MKKGLYTAIQWTWGLPQTLIGSALYLAHRKNKHFNLNGACATVWDREEGVSLGKFIFVPKQDTIKSEDPSEEDKIIVSKDLALHEYGHTVQSLILGPAYLLVVGLPSIIWSRHPHFIKKRARTGMSYYAPVFERTANKLGEKTEQEVLKRV